MKRVTQTGLDVLLFERAPPPLLEQPRACIDLPERGALASLYAISAILVDLLGPMFWAALFVLFVEAELSVS